MNISTKVLNTEDFNKVYELAELCGQSSNDIKYTIETAENFRIVGLFDSTTLVGYGVVEIHLTRDKNMSLDKYEIDDSLLSNSAILIGCSIHPDYRGMNLQKELIKERESYAKELNCSNLLVTTGEHASASRVNLLESGYRVIGYRVRNNGKIVYLMYKNINEGDYSNLVSPFDTVTFNENGWDTGVTYTKGIKYKHCIEDNQHKVNIGTGHLYFDNDDFYKYFMACTI